ncbi:MAG: PAS domain-containing protein, partial [Bacteroidales bacterium]
PEDWPQASQALEELFEGRASERALAYRVRHANGDWRWHEGRAVAVRGPLGEVISVVGVSRDITRQRQAEEELRRKMRELELAHIW